MVHFKPPAFCAGSGFIVALRFLRSSSGFNPLARRGCAG